MMFAPIRFLSSCWSILVLSSFLTTHYRSDALRPDQDDVMDDPGVENEGKTTISDDRNFPYYVLFPEARCGGVLIAADLVLTAAECSGSELGDAQVGRTDLSKNNFESFNVVKQIIHPLWSDGSLLDNNIMIGKLSGKSTAPILNIFPTWKVDTPPYNRVGFEYSAAGSPVGDVVKIDPVTDLKDRQFCYGGGDPLISDRGSAEVDILVGFASSIGRNPGCGSDIGHYVLLEPPSIDWITSMVCKNSGDIPDGYDCPQTTMSRIMSEAVDVTVELTFDDFPPETGWEIQIASTGEVVAGKPSGTYFFLQKKATEVVALDSGGQYIFKIMDAYGDGLCCNTPGSYQVLIDGDTILVEGNSNFGFSTSTPFTAGSSSTPNPTPAPVATTSPTSSSFPTTSPIVVTSMPTEVPVPTETPAYTEVQVRVTISFDDFPPETGWSITEQASGTTIFSVPIGAYPLLTQTRVEIVTVVAGQNYIFTILDDFNDGLCCEAPGGTYSVTQGNVELVSGGGNFGAREDTMFTPFFPDSNQN